MWHIKTFNQIDDSGLSQFKDGYTLNESEQADAIILRSHKLHDYAFPDSIRVVGRAGAGVNNIPVVKLTEKGIPVLNTPGANANAVKELVIAGMLIASRNICLAWEHVNALTSEGDVLAREVEAGKKQFAGRELQGKTLAVIGLGAIGVMVANAATELGMNVLGYDTSIRIENAWALSSSVHRATSIADVLPVADFVTVHVPLIKQTTNLINAEGLAMMKPEATLLNFSRDGIVDTTALLSMLHKHSNMRYVCDFPTRDLIEAHNVIALPHLGASTAEAERNCARMVAVQVKDFLENGNIRNSVNFPPVNVNRLPGVSRIVVINKNIPAMVAKVSHIVADDEHNIVDLTNKSRDEVAITLIDLSNPPEDKMLQKIAQVDGVLSVRVC